MPFDDVTPYEMTDWLKYHEYHDADSVQLGELVEVGWFNLDDTETWNWPKYSDEQDSRLRKKIVNHFWNRGIGILPPGLWKRQFLEKMDEIMPKYIALYKVLDESPQLLGAGSEYSRTPERLS